MFKPKIILIAVLALISILFFAGNSIAAPTAPTGVVASDLGGPVRLSWNASVGATSYTIYRVESDSSTITTNPPTAPYGQQATMLAFGVTNFFYLDTNVADGVVYYYFITAVNSDPVPESSPASLVVSFQTHFPKAGTSYGLNLTPTALQANGNVLIDYENSTLAGASTGTVINFTLANTDPNNHIWVANQIQYDIIDNLTTSSIFKEPPITLSSQSGISTGKITWDGSWQNTTQPTKHDGFYTFKIWAIDFAGNKGLETD